MTLLCSMTAGLLLDSDQPAPLFLNPEQQPPWQPSEAIHLLSTVWDWQLRTGDNCQAVVEQAIRDYWMHRCRDICMCLLSGLSRATEEEALSCVEDLLAGRADRDLLLSHLFVAPLQIPTAAQRIAQTSLGMGLPVTGAVFDELFILQPLLRRFTELWLELPAHLFVAVDGTRQHLWMRLVESGVLRKVLACQTRSTFRNAWDLLALGETAPSFRSAVVGIGVAIAERLFGSGALDIRPSQIDMDDDGNNRVAIDDERQRRRSLSAEERRDRALNQINAVIKEIAAGRDSKARRFLSELIAEQLSGGKEEFAVMSLCNVAQHCKDLFRTDFESECLSRAVEIAPHDARALIQISDLYKRGGDYERAIETATQIINLPSATVDTRVVAESIIADTWSERRQYSNAIAAYKSIDGWSDIPSVRTAIADNLRRMGHLAEAESEYDCLLAQGLSDRAMAGKAEVAKRRGDLDSALATYESILAMPATKVEVGKTTWVVYSLARCGILKMLGRLQEAFNVVDQVVQAAPFSLQARIQRSTVLALLGNPGDGLHEIAEVGGSTAFGQWILEYVRGLILLKLNRFDEARQKLVERMNSALAFGQSEVLLRAGAAIVFLIQDAPDNAESVINTVTDVSGYYEQYLLHVVQLHIAVARDDRNRIAEILSALDQARLADTPLSSAVLELKLAANEDSKRERLTRALKYELEFLLQAA